MPRTSLRAAVIAAALLVSATGAGAPPDPAAGGPATGTLPGGVAYEVRPDPAVAAAAVALWFRAPAGGFGDKALPGLSRLAAATVAGSAPITGTPLGRLVEGFGGRLSVTAYPTSVAVTALVPGDRVEQTVRAMTTDYFAPVVTQAGLQLAQREVAEDALLRSYDPPSAIEDALGMALFSRGPLHDGVIGSADALADLTVQRMSGFAERAFRPANAILVLTGHVDASALRAVAARQGASGVAEPAAEPAPAASPAATSASRESHVDGTGLGWVGPPIADEDAATALDFIADALFAPRTGAVQRMLGSRMVTVTGKFVTYRSPGVFLVTISGENAAAARAIVEQAVAAAATPMSAQAFAAARAGFVYRLLGDMDTPTALADTFGWYAVEGDPGYAPSEAGGHGRYFERATALTPESVARTAARYLGVPPVVVALSRPKAAVK